MEPCPNCGAPTRPGARFCTTCGHRLSGAATETANDAAAAEPTTTADTAGGGWAVPTVEPGIDADLQPAPAAASEPTPPLADDAPSPLAETPVPVDADDQAGAVGAGQGPAWPPPVSSWAAGWGSPPASPPVDQPQAEDDVVVEVDAAAPSWPSAWSVEPAGGHDAGAEEPAAGDAGAATAVAEEPAPEAPDTAGLLAEEGVAPERDQAVEPAARALALLDELRALVPELAAGAAGAGDGEAIAADLEAAIRPPDDESADEREGLRTALLMARERPRDIDTMLDLVGRVDAMLALLDAHDRAVAAIERAARRLRGAGDEPDAS